MIAVLAPAALAFAAAAPLATSGGLLDPAFPGAEVYLEKPAAGAVPPGPACAAAARYVELVNTGEAAPVADLYADDAFILEPVRRTIRGKAQITAFYAERLARMKPQVTGVSYLGNAGECMVALANAMPVGGQVRHVLVSIDHFLVGPDGKVKSMIAYARPPRE